MPQYQVTMNLTKADPLLNIGQLTEIVMKAILPSLEALKKLQSEGKVLAGGHPVGQLPALLLNRGQLPPTHHPLPFPRREKGDASGSGT